MYSPEGRITRQFMLQSIMFDSFQVDITLIYFIRFTRIDCQVDMFYGQHNTVCQNHTASQIK